MYCTLGNMQLTPRAGIVLVDFDRRQQLHLTGEVSVTMQPAGAADAADTCPRRWTLRSQQWVVSPLAGPEGWHLVDASPFNPRCAP